VAWTPVGLAGSAIVVLGAGSDLRGSPLGIGLSLAAVTTFTVYVLLTRIARSSTAVDPIEWMAGINFWAFAVNGAAIDQAAG
jgi:drug/metabolite transporter (DMT)-like permease